MFNESEILKKPSQIKRINFLKKLIKFKKKKKFLENIFNLKRGDFFEIKTKNKKIKSIIFLVEYKTLIPYI